MALLDKVKMACRITTTAFDTELTDLISAAFADMGVTDIRPDVLTEENITPLVQRAVTTYCRMHFGQPDDYERLKASYDEQKAQLLMSGDYTDWGVI